MPKPTCKAYSLHAQSFDVKAQGHFRTILKSLLNAASNGLWLIVIKEHLFKNFNATAVRVRGVPAEVANYRPMILTSVVCKVLERILKRVITSFLGQCKA